MKPYKHAQISARRFGGVPEDYIELHNWFDQTKAHVPDVRHRAILHNSFGIFLLEQCFGVTITNSEGRQVSVRDVGEQHVLDDLGRIPTLHECFEDMPAKRWFGGPVKAMKSLVIKPDMNDRLVMPRAPMGTVTHQDEDQQPQYPNTVEED